MLYTFIFKILYGIFFMYLVLFYFLIIVKSILLDRNGIKK